MKLVEYLNNKFKKFSVNSDFVFFGQNISRGSCLGGLLKNINSENNFEIMNTPNSENALVGFGFGLLLGKTNAAYFMKQQDFILLSTDQLKNTYSMIKNRKFNSSFNIVTTITDSGFEGSQSNFHNSYLLGSLLDCEIYDISNINEINYLFLNLFKKPGFRIINFSKKILTREISSAPVLKDKTKIFNNSIIKYQNGKDVTIVFTSFTYEEACKLSDKFEKKGLTSSLFCIFGLHVDNLDPILKDIKKTKNLIVVDDSLSNISISNKILVNILDNKISVKKYKIIKSKFSKNYQKPYLNELRINYKKIISYFINNE